MCWPAFNLLSPPHIDRSAAVYKSEKWPALKNLHTASPPVFMQSSYLSRQHVIVSLAKKGTAHTMKLHILTILLYPLVPEKNPNDCLPSSRLTKIDCLQKYSPRICTQPTQSSVQVPQGCSWMTNGPSLRALGSCQVESRDDGGLQKHKQKLKVKESQIQDGVKSTGLWMEPHWLQKGHYTSGLQEPACCVSSMVL